jgi:SAM-dependent methyltransferase
MSYTNSAQQWANLQKSKKHLSYDYLEKPAMYKLLQDQVFEDVLCLGCGTGEECEYIRTNCHSKSVLGIDNAEGLIEIAKNLYPEIEFKTLDMVDLNKITGKQFDLIYSSLALHYIEDWDKLLKLINTSLKPSGRLIFSTHHPIKWGSQTTRSKDQNSFLIGYQKHLKATKNQPTYTIFGDYLNPRRINDKLLGNIDIVYYHKSISNMFQSLTLHGFRVLQIIEPSPISEAKNLPNDFWDIHSKIPLFIIFDCKKDSE